MTTDKSKKLIEPGKWYAVFDENGNATEVVYDESYRRLLGFESEKDYTDEQKPWIENVHPDDVARVEGHIKAVMEKHPEGMDYDIEYRMMTKWGYRWFHDYAHCVRREDGSVYRCDGVVFDIQAGYDKDDVIAHERLREEVLNYMVNNEGDPIELLKNFAERIRVLIDCDQVIYRDLEDTRIMVNSPAIEKTWSVPIEYCQQCEHFDAHHPMYAGGYTEMDNCQEGWQGIPVYEKCPIKSSLTRIVYCDGEVAGYLAIHYVQHYHQFTDIERATLEEFTRILSLCLSRFHAKKENTELKQREYLEQQLQEALAMAEMANKSKSAFLFNMSHDIRTPLNAITGFTAMAKKYAADKRKVTDYLNKIDISGKQLLTLVNQVLEMSRIEAGRVEFDEKPVNIRERFEAMVTILAEQAEVKGIKFSFALKDVRHPVVLADDARMGQIVLNITGNALKYTPEGGSIDFVLQEKPCEKEGYARYTYTVADTGIGMSEEFQKVLFDPFTREKTSTVSQIQGTGLGMSIVRNIVDLMGGTIEVQSAPGKGTRFDITIDFKIDEAAEESRTDKAEINAGPVSFAGKRILLVEDNELNREIAKDILEEFGFIVEEADDGDVAVSMVETVAGRGDYGYYDLVLMDIQMPRMNGYEATRAIRALPGLNGSHLPIIAMTANAFEEDKRNAIAAGMDAHLAKPIDIVMLKETLAKYL